MGQMLYRRNDDGNAVEIAGQARHGVLDRMSGDIVYRSRLGGYRETHEWAEKRARGDRYEVVELNGDGTLRRD